MYENWYILHDLEGDAGSGFSEPAISTDPSGETGNAVNATPETPVANPGQVVLDQQTYQSLLSARDSARGNNQFFDRLKSNGIGSYDDISDDAISFIAQMKKNGMSSGYSDIAHHLFDEQPSNQGEQRPMTAQEIEQMVSDRVQKQLSDFSSRRDSELQYRSEYDKQLQMQEDALSALRKEAGIPGDLNEVGDDEMAKLLYYAMQGAILDSTPGVIQDEKNPMNGRLIPLGDNEIGTLRNYFSGIRDRLSSRMQFNAAQNVTNTPAVGSGSSVSGGQPNQNASVSAEDMDRQLEEQLLKVAEAQDRESGRQPMSV